MKFLETVRLQHNKVALALHKVREGSGRPLLLLHGLGEDAAGSQKPGPHGPGPCGHSISLVTASPRCRAAAGTHARS